MQIKISNNHWSPDYAHDWMAYEAGEEESGCAGYGSSEEDAVYDFLDRHILEHPMDVLHAINNHDALVSALDVCVTWFTNNQDCNLPLGVFLALKQTLESSKQGKTNNA